MLGHLRRVHPRCIDATATHAAYLLILLGGLFIQAGAGVPG